MILKERLPGGGMSEVYRAEEDGRDVALKLPKPGVYASPETLLQEVRLLSRLKHPALAAVLGANGSSRDLFGEEKGPYYWMEFVDGAPILEAGRGASVATVLPWLESALEALDYLHTQGVLHGDLTPNNLKVDGDGRLRLLDFGLSELSGAASHTRAATLPYAAPERMDGRLTPSGDLFSLGTVFYEILAGRHPRAKAKTVHELISVPAPPLLELAPAMRDRAVAARVIDAMTAVDSERRPASAREALEALRGRPLALPEGGGEGITARFFGAEENLRKVRELLRDPRRTKTVIAVHGPGGTGKTRFLREASLEAVLGGIAAETVRLEDQDAASFLSAVLRHRRSDKILFAVWSDDDVPPERRGGFAEILLWPETLDVALGNLSDEDARDFIASARPDLSGKAAARLIAETGGNPLLLATALRFLGREAKPAAFGEIIGRRLRGLTEDERSLLTLVAAAEEPVSQAELEKILGPGAGGILGRLKSQDFLRREEGSGLYRLAIPRLRDAVPVTRETREAWLGVWKDRPDDDARKFTQRLALGDAAFITANVLAVLDRLWREGHKDRALDLAGRSLAVVEDRVVRARLFKEKMNLLGDRQDFQNALEAAERWFELGPDNDAMPVKTVKHAFATGLYHFNLGNGPAARSRLETVLKDDPKPADKDTKTHLHHLRARASNLLGELARREGHFEDARRFVSEALELAAPAGRDRAEILRNRAALLAAEDQWDECRRDLAAARDLYEEAAYAPGVFASDLQEGNLALESNRWEDAERAFLRSEETARAADRDLLLGSAWNNLAVVERRRGRLEDSLKHARAAAETLSVLGSPAERAEAFHNAALSAAAAGLFEEAEGFLGRLNALKENSARGIASAIAFYRDGSPPPSGIKDLWPDPSLDPETYRTRLIEGRNALPPALRARFDERHDARSLAASPATPVSREVSMPATPSPDWTHVSRKLGELNRLLLGETDMERVLKILMDAAMDLARAKNGFLLLQSDRNLPEAPIPGFEVAVSRRRGAEGSDLENALSLSVVRQALRAGDIIVTDDAVLDERFRDAASVHLGQFKSIVALPVPGPKGPLGVFYLDHPMEEGLFRGELLTSLRLFADLAGLALEKARMIGGLKAANEGLSEKVDEQASQVQLLEREVKRSRRELKNEYADIIGRSRAMQEVLSLVDKITDSKIAVWVYGESGTGKEAIARALHFNSARKAAPFVTENCGALPETLLESELFGHKKGAFTHAAADKKGLLHYADGGTVFLDEIADMSPTLQAKLLRFLQEGEIRPVGSNQVVTVDVRVVSASNKDLARLVAEGKFREDLYFRLNGLKVSLPPLRERKEDLPLLAGHFLQRIAEREKRSVPKLDREAMALLLDYAWPGNVRELQNTFETAYVFAEHGKLTRRSFRFKEALFARTPSKPMALPSPASSEVPASSVASSPEIPEELARILRALRDHLYRKAAAARALAMSRPHLYIKLRQYGLPTNSVELKEFVEKNLS